MPDEIHNTRVREVSFIGEEFWLSQHYLRGIDRLTWAVFN